jgi:thioredoxin family protein
VQSPETYAGYARATGFASPEGLVPDRRQVYVEPVHLGLNQWALSGTWTVAAQVATSGGEGDRIVHRFHGRDLNLVLGSKASHAPVRVLVTLDGTPPGDAHGLDVDERGAGVVSDARLYQLIRQDGPISDRTVEITFRDPGAQAYVFTFG